MSIRNLDAVLKPRSVALIGASSRPRAIGGVLARNLIRGAFTGRIDLVSAHTRSVDGVACLRGIDALDPAPDLAILATPAPTLPALVAELGRRGTRGVAILAASEDVEDRHAARGLAQRILDAAKPNLVRVLGPDSVGVILPALGLNASTAHVMPNAGGIAFVTQSGAVATSVLDWAAPRGIGFSRIVSLGAMADIDVGDLLDWLANDGATRAILLYVETITGARKFMSAARIAARIKPVIVIKAGRHDAAARAAESHTGALAGVDGVYDAAFRRAGMLRVRELSELFDAVETVSRFASGIAGERLAIVTNGGGLGVMATDSLVDQGGTPAPLSATTVAALDAVLPRSWPHANPIDIAGDAGAERYEKTLDVVLAAPELDAALVVNGPSALADSLAAADATIAAAKRQRRPVLTSWVGESVQGEARRRFAAAGLPTFDTPTEAVRGFMHLVRHRRNREALMQVPSAAMTESRVDQARAAAILAAARTAGRRWLMAHESLELVAAYGIPTPRAQLAASPAKAAGIAARSEGALALKLVSPDVTHKSEVGGVILNLSGAEAVRAAAETMLQRVARVAPQARVEGFLVQEMVRRSAAHELIAGISLDPQFGPVVLFGAGGSSVEIVRDTALALPPLNRMLARELMSRTRVFELLQGYRDTPAADLDAVADALIRLSQLASDHAELVELDINPLVADERGVTALDARIRIDPARTGRGDAGFAIRPWPSELVERPPQLDGAVLRPIRPEDAAAIDALIARMTPEDTRMRFFAPVKELPRPMLARLTQIDYDREMALVIESAPGEITGVVRISCDPDNVEAEYAVLVRSDLKGKGRGTLLMQRIIAYARARGVRQVWGDILRENKGMIALAKELGFVIEDVPESREIVRARLKLQ